MSLENISPQTGNTFNYNCWFTPSGNASSIIVNWKNTNYTSFAAYRSATSQDGNSIFSNPMFSVLTLPTPNLHLLTGSPCINTGKPSTAVIIGETDYEGNSRLIGNIDIGAYEFKITTGIVSAAVNTLSTVAFPNPFQTETTLLFNEDLTDGMLEIYNPEGKKVQELTAIHGNHINLQRGTLPAGIYFYVLIQTPEFVCTGKLIAE